VEKPEQFLFQLEAPLPGRRTEVVPEELAAQTDTLRGVAAWAAGMQAG
jgi:hypothetical protein